MDSAERGDDLGLYSPEDVSTQIDIALLYGYDLVKRVPKGNMIRLFGIKNPAAPPRLSDFSLKCLERVAA